MVENRIVEVLVKLYVSERGQAFQVFFLSKDFLHLFFFYICFYYSFCRNIGSQQSITTSPLSTPTASSFLSVASSAAVLKKSAELLSSTILEDIPKIEVLNTLLQLVNAGVMNEAAEFVAWRQTGTTSAGGGSGSNDEKLISFLLFVKSFAAFAEGISSFIFIYLFFLSHFFFVNSNSGIALVKKRTVLGYAAKMVHDSIQGIHMIVHFMH
jgi:hypothetical protein